MQGAHGVALRVVLGLALALIAPTQSVEPRRSCRHHYLAGISKSSVLPLRHGGVTANVYCRFPDHPDTSAIINTVIHSGLEKPHQVKERRTVEWQVKERPILNDIISRATCHQKLTIKWKNITAHNHTSGDLTVVSLLSKETPIKRSAGLTSIILTGDYAGIEHVLPDIEHSPDLPIIETEALVCEETLLRHQRCLIDTGAEIKMSPTHGHFHFAFRTDVNNQILFTVQLGNLNHTSITVEFYTDFFLETTISGSKKLVESTRLSDGAWHTVSLALDSSHFKIDEERHELKSGFRERITSVGVKLNGEVMLIDPSDEKNECADEKRVMRNNFHLQPRSSCAGAPCECVLSPIFTNLPSPGCRTEHSDDSFQLFRHSDLLSFLFLPNALSIEPLQLAVAFRSDSDSGLIFFGEWTKNHGGRLQVHYHGNRVTAIHCSARADKTEECIGCSIQKDTVLGSTDDWVHVTLFSLMDDRYLTVDNSICRLRHDGDQFDTAEMYKTVSTRDSVLFVGGMFNKKVRPGIYKDEFKMQFFENTREKLPSLRGCIKYVFVGRERLNLFQKYLEQVENTVVDNDQEKYAMRMGCGFCPSGCPPGSRCRPQSNVIHTHFICDCADVFMYTQPSHQCMAQREPALSLSSLNTFVATFEVPRVKGTLAKLWMTFAIPTIQLYKEIVIVKFLSHGAILFRLYLTPTSELKLEVTPEDTAIMGEHASLPIDTSDPRLHQLTIEKRTPLGTHPSRRFFDLHIDGSYFSIPDPGLAVTEIEFTIFDAPEEEAGCVTDLGLGFDSDEQMYLNDSKNAIQQMNILEQNGGRSPRGRCGILDPSLWARGKERTDSPGHVVDFRPESSLAVFGGPLSASWFFYSLILTIVLILLSLACLLFYFCFLRDSKRKRRSSSDDRQRIMTSESPDYIITLRKPIAVDRDSCISDSIDRTDFSAYDDIKTHKVKVDRESMISFMEPTTERNQTAQIVHRTPSPSDAPLVDLADIGQ